EPGNSEGLAFPLEGVQSGVLKLKAGVEDDLAIDNVAWSTLNPPQPMKVLVVTPGNRPLALATEKVRALAEIVEHSPDYLKQPDYQKQSASGNFDLIVYDRCRPEQMPQADTMFIDRLPVGELWKAGEPVAAPQIIDT